MEQMDENVVGPEGCYLVFGKLAEDNIRVIHNDQLGIDERSLYTSHSNTAIVILNSIMPESAFGGRLMLFYINNGRIPKNAVGFWCAGPGKSIQGFKFKQNEGRVEVIRGIAGGDQNRKKYFSGWCQFIKLAKLFNGYVIKFRE